MSHIQIAHYNQITSLPSPCTAFSQSLSVNSFRDVSEANHVTWNTLAARKNEA